MRYVFALIIAALALPAVAQVPVDPSAGTSVVKCEWCLTVSAAPFTGNCIDRATGSAVVPLAGARNVTAENRSSATSYVEWDGSNVTTTGTTGDKWAAGDKWSLDVGSKFLGQATGAATAAQTTGACLFIRQWK